MLQAERQDDDLETGKIALESWQRSMWTALPGIIRSATDADGCVTVSPAIKARLRSKAGVESDVALPLLIHVPVLFLGGGGFSISMPVAVGDECLVVFSSRCIDSWWQSGGVQSQIELRMHDLSDGFCIPGFRSKPRALPSINGAAAELRSDDGTTYLRLEAGKVTLKGDLHVTGAVIAGYGGGDQVGLQTHRHTQPNDSHGDTEVPTNAPTAGT